MTQIIKTVKAKANEAATKFYFNTQEPAAGFLAAGRSKRSGRGATFIEYALLAGLAVVLFLAIRGPLSGVVDDAINFLNRGRN